MIQSPLALATLIAGVTALAFWLDYRFPALGKLGASMMAIIFGAILSNTGLVPVASPVYDAVLGPVTSVSIAWLLLSVDLRDLAKAGPRMTGAFGIAVLGTVLGAFVAAMSYGPRFGDDTSRIAGARTGTYSGGKRAVRDRGARRCARRARGCLVRTCRVSVSRRAPPPSPLHSRARGCRPWASRDSSRPASSWSTPPSGSARPFPRSPRSSG